MKLFVAVLVASLLSAADTGRDLRATLSGLKTDEQITILQNRLKAQPGETQIQTLLARALLQKLRETMDPVYLRKAGGLVDGMLSRDPKSYEALRLQNEIDMQRHEFPEVAKRAADLLDRNPSDAGMVGMLGDALMELGRYDEAGAAYQRMVELSPNLTSYNRLAYQRYVTGKTDEALSWMNQAVRAGSKSAENEAWCLTEFGDLLFKTGKAPEAKMAYVQALDTFPGYHRANAALARVLAPEGDTGGSVAHLKEAQARVPLPEYAAMLAALYEQSGQKTESERQRALIDAINKLMKANGETMNRNLAVIFADEDRELDRALELAKAEFAVRDDVFTYDALSWVLYKRKSLDEAWEASKKATALGTPDPMLHFHAGLIALAVNRREVAKEQLERTLALNPKFDFRYAPQARQALASVSRDASK